MTIYINFVVMIKNQYCSTAVLIHCCKGDQPNLWWRMAKAGLPELRNPRTDFHKI